MYFVIKWILKRVEKMKNNKGSSNKYQNNFIYLFEAATEFTSEDEGKCEMQVQKLFSSDCTVR